MGTLFSCFENALYSNGRSDSAVIQRQNLECVASAQNLIELQSSSLIQMDLRNFDRNASRGKVREQLQLRFNSNQAGNLIENLAQNLIPFRDNLLIVITLGYSGIQQGFKNLAKLVQITTLLSFVTIELYHKGISFSIQNPCPLCVYTDL